MEKNEKISAPPIMTIKELSVFLRIPVSTVYDLAQKGKIPGVKFGKHWRFLRADVLEKFSARGTGLPPHERRIRPSAEKTCPSCESVSQKPEVVYAR
ncbi:MAG: helix-turn-helix domain-containing protein [Candidatus Omnitrophica bacterium]|nr:helix-turn-helix domain-containing protein [Sinomicrobium sp.]MCB9800356.1 helix-turn-helix domain-containing protein [Candidatus Omnitrophota bacterium]